ncbi:HNH endonuclease [Variovorax fucosicus]|uniref:HNH endonuclease n=1 Tax=Variovorax fucosicus TaxID=3053517 RepID=UPI0025763849|nr:HNH endonuclease signature motif containing protein [Variovorax sp. J22G47]MDM0054066.1 HNH endonuclease signature motif containing protein [Variovorax sp. J22G47]
MPATHSPYPRPAAQQLAQLYTTMGFSCPDIGWLYERDAKTVHYWLRQAGIPTRTRGSNTAVHFKTGERSAFAGRRHTPESIAKVKASTIADGRVPYLRGGQHWLKGLPPDANPNWKGGATPERQEFYRSAEWKVAVKAVWQRANACCERCALDWRTVDRSSTPTFHLHHRVSFAVRELRAAVGNLVLLCRPCHLWVHSSANVDRHFLLATERDPSAPNLFDMEEVAA